MAAEIAAMAPMDIGAIGGVGLDVLDGVAEVVTEVLGLRLGLMIMASII